MCGTLTEMKTEEFVAHSTNVNCLSIGKKACRLFITGGDDHKVNLWAIGKPTSLMTLCGHTSPVESVAFDTAEVLVLAGASTGVIKLWDLEEAKMLRTLTGHSSNCTAAEFHPFGEFFASGSTDTNLKIWDIRKKGCIHTYKGHTRGISTIRFTPDGRWVVSGGFDNVVKVWDLTAGKLIHDFKFHEGHIRSLDFHPLEFLLATGSADGTVKFWDLETFDLIGSTRPEATGVRTITFHPDGRTLFCGLDDSLKVYSWEPVIFHDAIGIGWSTLGDLCINEGKLLGCSHYRNSVAVWVADISLIEPYGVGFVPEESDCAEKKFNISKSDSPVKARTGERSASDLRSISPEYEIKEIKNIYVDSTGGIPVSSQKAGSLSSPNMVLPVDSKEMINPPTEKKSSTIEVTGKASGEALNKSFVVPTVVPRDSAVDNNSSNSGRGTVTFSRTKPGMLLRPAHIWRPSNSKNDVEKLSVALESETSSSVTSEKESAMDLKSQSLHVSEDGIQNSCEENKSTIKSVADKFEKILSPETPTCQENCDESIANSNKGIPSVKIVNGVAVVAGRTRSLVERFERREKFSSEDQSINMASQVAHETNRISNINPGAAKETDIKPPTATSVSSLVMPENDRKPPTAINTSPLVMPETDRKPPTSVNVTPHFMPETDRKPPTSANVPPHFIAEIDRKPSTETNMTTHVIPETDRKPPTATNMPAHAMPETKSKPVIATNMTLGFMPEMGRTPAKGTALTPRAICERDRKPTTTTNVNPRVVPETDRSPPIATEVTPRVIRGMDRAPSMLEEPQISGSEPVCSSYRDISEDLMRTHDVFLSTLKSRLTKLQVVRHFWEQNDIKGAINGLRKLQDPSVQADVISILMEKMEILTLDLFSCLLPVLVGLLESKMERHTSVSLEMLLKLVAVFGPIVRSTISAPPAVGVDLHAEQRLECCKQCFVQLQNIQQILPLVTRRISGKIGSRIESSSSRIIAKARHWKSLPAASLRVLRSPYRPFLATESNSL
ncbi:katanin p80 WD40 repeat-containing subunit B1 homolog KTN80.1 isoform X3 [Manihot esculenta]|uniref:katanin p80 WD40 repeat-containing subunit B1 homolog KTN80.1 isoform X3 n=1 Tax=Manihot esculenta TaxID=3983 RepID=UPI001CC4617E|nr:katanin p80 WD40 repeat-containing subunit B1 homolog KTN80.1 isoform X3 [Manihot esculenta]